MMSENLSAANSRIRDVDVAYETSNMTSYQILQQAGVAMLAQANMTTGLAMNLGWALTFVVVTLLLAEPWGADGLAVARLFAYSIHAVWTLGFAIRLTGPK